MVVPPVAQSVNGCFATAEEFRKTAGTPFSADFYTRHGNENHRQAGAVVAALEGAETALVAGSGRAVTTAVLSVVSSGDHVVAQSSH